MKRHAASLRDNRSLTQGAATQEAGYAIGVVKDGRVIFAQGFGYRDRANQLPVTPQTRFFIGSNTKSFTALGLALLQSQGKFDFEAKVSTYLPGFHLIDRAVSQRLTTSDMLAHRSGLPRHDRVWRSTGFTRSEIISRIPFFEMDKRPGYGYRGKFNYNNLLFAAAGTETEAISGESWESYTGSKILSPLGMDSTSFALDGMTGNPEASLSYHETGLQLPWTDATNMGPAGSINSTVPDMLKYLQFYLDKGVNAQGMRLISEASLVNLFLPRIAMDHNVFGGSDCFSGASSCQNYYGLGWAVQYDGRYYLGYHGGHLDGFYSFMSVESSRRLGIVVLSNSNSGPDVVALGRALNQYFLYPGAPAPGGVRALASAAEPSALESDLNVTSGVPGSPAGPVALLATFAHAGYGDLNIITDGQVAYLQYYKAIWQLEATATPDVLTYMVPGYSGFGSGTLILNRGGVPGGQVISANPGFEANATSIFRRAVPSW